MQKIANAFRRLTTPEPTRTASVAAIEELKASREQLQQKKNHLGNAVFTMMETGDSLAALVHGARDAQFRRQITIDPET